MTKAQLMTAGIALNGFRAWGWQSHLAEELGVSVSTIHRWASPSDPTPMPEVARVAIRLLVERRTVPLACRECPLRRAPGTARPQRPSSAGNRQ